jgi:hypothetical protein
LAFRDGEVFRDGETFGDGETFRDGETFGDRLRGIEAFRGGEASYSFSLRRRLCNTIGSRKPARCRVYLTFAFHPTELSMYIMRDMLHLMDSM